MFWCVPLSTKQKRFDFYFNFTDPNGLKVSVILAQLKLTSIKRLKRKLYEIEPDLLVRMKEKLQTLVSSLQHIVPDITPTILLSNILADHLSANRELITRVANEGLKRSLASTFNNEKE